MSEAVFKFPVVRRRNDIQELVDELKRVSYTHAEANGLTVTEAVGALEMAKYELLQEQQ
jgi:hypothetical protein